MGTPLVQEPPEGSTPLWREINFRRSSTRRAARLMGSTKRNQGKSGQARHSRELLEPTAPEFGAMSAKCKINFFGREPGSISGFSA